MEATVMVQSRRSCSASDISPGLRGLSDFTELKGVVVTIAGKLLAHKLYHFRLEWSHWKLYAGLCWW